ncbi:hypothetical protein B0A49_08387 [Cryomyces minteri]|uniref:Uncharacterized protein n=1 Tax=Cryomyces minteri TaxID=331657 RepID=A0A4U0X2B2_9PEZI|nr:hypothetical protein B0A49_08387 [Cryomyces minteri]
MEMVVDDLVPSSPALLSRVATVSGENSKTNPPIFTPGLNHVNQPENLESWTDGQETATPDVNQLHPRGDWLSGQEGLTLGEPDSFQDGDYGLTHIGQQESFWHWDDFDTSFWPDGMDFSFADDSYAVASSTRSIAGYFPHKTAQSELQAALVGHQSTKNAMEMMQLYFEQISRPSSPRREQPKNRWFSAPPRIQIYDEEVMNVFAHIADHHLANTIPILADFSAIENRRKELHLAYAAVGGLFCNIPGRFKVVNSMYNDARRMLLDPTYQRNVRSLNDRLSTVKTVGAHTFILLEVYGLCSGDKRSYEFVEAFHAKMLSAVEEYKRTDVTQEMPPEQLDNKNRFRNSSTLASPGNHSNLLLDCKGP